MAGDLSLFDETGFRPDLNEQVLREQREFFHQIVIPSCTYFGLPPENFQQVLRLIRGKQTANLHPSYDKMLQKRDEIQPQLQPLILQGAYIDVEFNAFANEMEVDISHEQKLESKHMQGKNSNRTVILHPGRGERSTRLTIGENRFHIIFPDLEIDYWAEHPGTAFTGALSIYTRDQHVSVPYGCLTFVADRQDFHRSALCISGIESEKLNKNDFLPEPTMVYASNRFGVQAYYTEQGILHSIGMYFTESKIHQFGVWYPDGRTEYKQANGEMGKRNFTRPPIFRSEATRYYFEREGEAYSFEHSIDIHSTLNDIAQRLHAKLGVVNE